MIKPDLNVRDYPNLEPFISEQNTKFVSYLLAHQYRRGRARNAAFKYGIGVLSDPSYISGANRDLLIRYNNLIKLVELDRESTILYENLIDARLQAELIIENLRDMKKLDYDQRREQLIELTKLEDDIQRLTDSLEDLDSA